MALYVRRRSLTEGWRVARRARGRGSALRVTAALATMHLSWGAGFLEGCRRFGVPWRALLRLARSPRSDVEPRPSTSRPPELRVGYVVSRFPALSETFVLRELAEVDGRPDVRCELFSLFPERAGRCTRGRAHGSPRRGVLTGRRGARGGLLGRAPAAATGRGRGRSRRATTAAARAPRARARHRRLRPAARPRAGAEPVDHLHAHFATYPALAAWTCSRLVGVPTRLPPTPTTSSSIGWGCAAASRTPRSVSASPSTTRASCARPRRGAARRPCRPLPACIRGRIACPAARPAEPAGRCAIACVAALKPYKGHRVLLDAVARLADAGEAVGLDLAGTGPLHDELARRCVRLGIAARVSLLGDLTEPEVADVLDRADVFALAGVMQPDGDTDGIPVALMEAMAAGLPVVASDLPGVRELVRHGETGCWRPPGDAAALAGALRTVAVEPEAAVHRARAARALVEEHFAVPGEASRLLALIRQGRLAREAAFHDEAFAHGTRRGTWRFYDAGRDAYDRYDELIAAAVVPGASVLEYGMRGRRRACALARRGARVHGIDISPVAIEHGARRRATGGRRRGRPTFSVMDAEALDLPARSFGLVCGTSILHHLDVDRAYREIARVLAPSGRAIFLEPLGHNPVFNAYRRLTPSARTQDEHPLRMVDLETARRALRRPCVGAFRPRVAAGRGTARLPRVRPARESLAADRPAALHADAAAAIVVVDGRHRAVAAGRPCGTSRAPAASGRRTSAAR